jgi:hypothetical protein
MTNLNITEWYSLHLDEMYDKLKYNSGIALSLTKCMTNVNITEWHSLQLHEMYDRRNITEWYSLQLDEMYDRRKYNRVA